MSIKINISIPQPCHENWEEMTDVEKGKFCSSCQKKVFDFTKASDKEIIKILNTDNVTCGRFTSSQLNRNLYTNQPKSSYWLVAGTAVLGFLGLVNQSSYAQVKHDTIQVNSEDMDKAINSKKPNLPFKIYGNVVDEFGVIPGANVIVKGTHKGAVTDFNGNFELEVYLNDIIQISYIGFLNEEITITSNKDYKIILQPDEDVSNYIIVGGIGMCKKRTFLGRIFQKIGNIFK